MRELFEDFTENTFWYWTATIVIAIAVGYCVNMFWDLTWGVIHGAIVLMLSGLIYSIAKPNEKN